MRKLLLALSLVILSCGGSDGKNTSAIQTYALPQMCSKKASSSITGVRWMGNPTKPENYSTQPSITVGTDTTTFSQTCTVDYSAQPVTVSVTVKSQLTNNQLQILEQKESDAPFGDSVCHVGSDVETFNYTFEGSCLKLVEPGEANPLYFTPATIQN